MLLNDKMNWAWWHMPIVPATWEAEVGGAFEPGGGGCSEPRLCHCTLAWVTEQDSVSKTNKKENTSISFSDSKIATRTLHKTFPE